jgi:hypothetical protein
VPRQPIGTAYGLLLSRNLVSTAISALWFEAVLAKDSSVTAIGNET